LLPCSDVCCKPLQSGLPRFETRHRVVLGRLRPSQIQPGDVARFTNATNAAARMIDVYQNACLILQKFKTKGTQRVVVQQRR